MNKERRKKIKEATKMIERGVSILQDVANEEMDALENLPDAIRDSERGMEMEEGIEYLESAISDIPDYLSDIKLL